MDNLGNVSGFHGNDIESDLSLPVSTENKFFSGVVNQAALKIVNKTLWFPIGVRISRFYLHEYQPILTLSNEVNFPAPRSVIPRYDPESLVDKKRRGEIFTNASGFDFIGHSNVIPLKVEFTNYVNN
jgi:hypothetical protein